MSSPISWSPGYRMKFDKIRNQWLILAPEAVFVLDEVSKEFLDLVDGERSVDEICMILFSIYDAPYEIIYSDISEIVNELRNQGALSL